MNKNEIFLHFFLNSTSLVDSTFFQVRKEFFTFAFLNFLRESFFHFLFLPVVPFFSSVIRQKMIFPKLSFQLYEEKIY